MTVGDKLFLLRLEAAIDRHWGEVDALTDVACEVCGSLIHSYHGPIQSIICATCKEHSRDKYFCGNTYPADDDDWDWCPISDFQVYFSRKLRNK